jgi:hypothetical protein
MPTAITKTLQQVLDELPKYVVDAGTPCRSETERFASKADAEKWIDETRAQHFPEGEDEIRKDDPDSVFSEDWLTRTKTGYESTVKDEDYFHKFIPDAPEGWVWNVFQDTDGTWSADLEQESAAEVDEE